MKKRYKILIGLIIIFTVLLVLPYLFQDSNQLGKFRTEDGERKYKEAYSDAMKLLPQPNRRFDVETDFGVVRVYEFVNDETELEIPIVLLPGRNSGTPMWAENLEGLLSERKVYTIDILGDAGLSVQSKPIETADDQALWLEQVFEEMELSQLHLIGHSFGGWNAANYTVHYPNRVMTLSLLEPVFVFTGLRWDFYVKSIPDSLPFLPNSMRGKLLADIGGTTEIDMNDPLARMIAEATEHYSVNLPLPKVIKKKKLSEFKMPIYVALGGKSVIHDSQKAYNSALQNIKELEIKIWEDGTHSLPMEYVEEINQELLEFMRRIDDIR